MNFNDETKVKDIALSNPAARQILEDAGLDYCCGGGKSLHEACLHADVPAERILNRLRENSKHVSPDEANWTLAPFPFFVRMAYGWLLVAALLGVGAALWDSSGGIWGASRHALTVGFIAVMVFCVGQRILPAFAGMRLLWSTRLMFAGLMLLTIGCTLRVSSEVLAYQGYANWAWSVLPASALLELAGITAFAMNIFGTFMFGPSHVQKQPLVVGINQAVPYAFLRRSKS